MNEIIALFCLIGMSGYMGYAILTIFNYNFNKNPLKNITFFEGLKNFILCIITGAISFIIGVPFILYIKSFWKIVIKN